MMQDNEQNRWTQNARINALPSTSRNTPHASTSDCEKNIETIQERMHLSAAYSMIPLITRSPRLPLPPPPPPKNGNEKQTTTGS